MTEHFDSDEVHLLSRDPRTGEPVFPGLEVTRPQDLEIALANADRAGTTFRRATRQARAGLLRSVAARLENSNTILVAAADRETALGEPRLNVELKRTCFQLRMFADALETGTSTLASDPGDPASGRPRLIRLEQPIGPVLVFGASNFPFAFSVMGGDSASALAAGCPVLFKAHESHLSLSRLAASIVRDALSEAGLPTGVFQLLVGQAPAQAALRDPRVRAAGFTGSTSAGRALFDIAVAREDPIPFYGELGGVNPVVIAPGAFDRRRAELLDGFFESFTLSNGQFCTKPGLLFLPRSTGLVEDLRRRLDPTVGQPLLSERIQGAYLERLQALSDIPGVTLIGSAQGGTVGFEASPSLVVATVADLFAPGSDLVSECFGPTSVVVEYDDAIQLTHSLRSLPGCLVACVHAEPEDHDFVNAVLDAFREIAGRVVYNGWPTGVSVSPAMHHGGPWPASTFARFTAVGTSAIERWLRPIALQGFPS